LSKKFLEVYVRFFKTFIFLSVIFLALTLGPLLLLPLSGDRGGEVAAQTVKLGQAASQNPRRELVDAPSKFALNSAGDVIDMTRLVLESTRDHTANLTNFIERATTVIVVFFTLLGAVAAAFGWSKLRDMEDAAKTALSKFQGDLDQLNAHALGGQTTFHEKLDAATAQVHREINNQIELIAARAEIDQAINGKFELAMSNRMLANACKRIDVVLADQQVSTKARIRGMADAAFAKKRLGQIELALDAVVAAANLAEGDQPEMYPLLAYNAACYSCLLGKSDALTWLAAAIKANPQHKDGAKADTDFATLKDDPNFQSLVQ
jgi:hypothetical protein